jgi:hypothetical protein
LNAELVIQAEGSNVPPAPPAPVAAEPPRPTKRTSDVKIDLRLWDQDAGKMIRVRAPQSISQASFDRFIQAFRLLVRIENAEGGSGH